eukprot:sb/3475446/
MVHTKKYKKIQKNRLEPPRSTVKATIESCKPLPSFIRPPEGTTLCDLVDSCAALRARVGKCGLGSFDFNCGLVWLVFIKNYTMAINGTHRCIKAVVEVVGVYKSCRRNTFDRRTSVKYQKHVLKGF